MTDNLSICEIKDLITHMESVGYTGPSDYAILCYGLQGLSDSIKRNTCFGIPGYIPIDGYA